ncbi:D-2-hydroxyacid dehydrogenase [Arthrobacter sulfonylureivorans]|uniref:D-2-hydroxyacid dehydrogenase n=1 Tax=Arthrobacter sulfonylureivorans TaxID=2486855 RepID=UPI0039E613AE
MAEMQETLTERQALRASDRETAPATTDKPVVAVLYKDHLPPGMEDVEAAAEVRYATADQLAEALEGAQVLLLWDFFSSALEDAWHAAGSLEWIHVVAAGVDKLLFDDLRESGVVVTNARGIFDRPMAEFVLAGMLAFAKNLPGLLSLQREQTWQHRETERLESSRALIVGTGSIGREIARVLKAMGLHVAGSGRTARSGDEDLGEIYASSELADVVGGFDWVVMVAPLTEQTRHLIDASVLKAMKPSARLINVGRGASVDTQALVEALRAGAIAGAALDVFEIEPLPADHPLWSMDNVIISPHLSGDARGWLPQLAGQFADNFGRYVRQQPLENVIDKKLGFAAPS